LARRIGRAAATIGWVFVQRRKISDFDSFCGKAPFGTILDRAARTLRKGATMSTLSFEQHAVRTARVLALAPVLVAALIGALPLLLAGLASRCCRVLIARIRQRGG
jgi:hypothetical protein